MVDKYSDQNRKPLISVVLPVFNGGQYLRPALESILSQTFGDFELIVINDGSSDETQSIIDSFASRDSRIRVVSRENKGLVFSLNEGVSLARGEFIARMDADDIALPLRFEQQLHHFRDFPDCVCVGGHVEIMDERGRKLTVWQYLRNDSDIQDQALRGHGTICHPAAMIRRRALLQVGAYRSDFYPVEDLDLWLRLGEVGTLANIDHVVLRYRMVATSISGQAAKDGKQRAMAQICCESAWRRRGLSSVKFEASAPWRWGNDADAVFKQRLEFGWWAYSSGEHTTAASYGWQAWRKRPWSKAAFVLWIKAIMLNWAGSGQ